MLFPFSPCVALAVADSLDFTWGTAVPYGEPMSIIVPLGFTPSELSMVLLYVLLLLPDADADVNFRPSSFCLSTGTVVSYASWFFSCASVVCLTSTLMVSTSLPHFTLSWCAADISINFFFLFVKYINKYIIIVVVAGSNGNTISESVFCYYCTNLQKAKNEQKIV